MELEANVVDNSIFLRKGNCYICEQWSVDKSIEIGNIEKMIIYKVLHFEIYIHTY